jgi:RimJ/RimL family protein N-acetyltransferase
MHIETERLCLRPMRAEDIPALVALWMDPDVTRYLGGPRERVFLEQTFAEDLANPAPPVYDLWPVIERSSGQLVGHCGLLDKEVEGQTEIDLTYIFAPSAWGRGYASEITRALVHHAASVLQLPRLIALIEPDNTGSQRVALKLGMSHDRDLIRPGNRRVRLYRLPLDRSNTG